MKIQEKNMSSTIKSVDKALSMLEAFSELDGGINLTRLSEKLGLNKSGVYRLLQVFKQRGYVEQHCRSGKYQLGLSAFRVSHNILSNNQLINIVKPFMEALVNEHNETIYLAINCDDHVLFFDHVDSLNAVNVSSLKGRFYPVETCAAGLVQKAFSATPAVLEKTISESREIFVQVRQQGYSMDQDQLGQGVASLAVPLFGLGNKVVGSLCFVGPDFRLTIPKIQDQLLGPLLGAGRAISIKLGNSGIHNFNLPATTRD